jgi:hypothetical protein
LLGVRLGPHRHKINRNQSAQVAQSDLPRRLERRRDVEVKREALRVAGARSRARVDIDRYERCCRLNRQRTAAFDWRRAREAILDGRIELGAYCRVRRLGQHKFLVGIVSRDSVRPFAIVASLVQFNDRILAARGLARDANNHAPAFGQRDAITALPNATIFAKRQKTLLIAQSKVHERPTSTAINVPHARAVHFAPPRAPAFIARARYA